MKIRNKISLLLILFGISITIPLAIFLYIEKQQLTLNYEKENLEQTSKEFAKFMGTLIDDKINLTLTLSSSSLMKKSLLESNNYYNNFDEDDRKNNIKKLNDKWISTSDKDNEFIKKYTSNNLAKYLKQQQKLIKNMYGEIFITNKYGALIASTGKLTTFSHKHKYWWKESYDNGKGKIFLDDRGFDESVNGYVLGIVIPIYNNNEIIGIIKSNINIKGPLTKLIIQSKMLYSLNMALTRSNGLIISAKDVEPLSRKINSKIIKEFKKKNMNNFVFNNEIIAYAKVPIENNILKVKMGSKNISESGSSENWYIVIHHSIDNVLNNTSSFERTLFIMFLILIIFILFFSFLIANTISTPIKDIINNMKKIGKGNLLLKIKKNSNDEMGELVDSINLMTYSLNKVTASKDELQQEIKRKIEYENVINTSNLVSRTNKHGTIIYANNAFCEIIGYSQEELLGNNHRILKPDNVSDEIYKHLWNTITSKKIWRGVIHNITKEKSDIYLNTTISPILDSNDNIIEYIATRFDITENINKNNELKLKDEILTQQSKMATMGEMISYISHQWRQPLNRINGLSSLIHYNAELHKDDEIIDYTHEIEHNVEYLNDTIEYFSKYLHNNNDNKSKFSIISIVKKSILLSESRIKTHNISIKYDETDNTEIYGVDKNLIQVILIILNNAIDNHIIKNTQNPLITIKTEETASHINLVIKDNGGGIIKENIEKIFDIWFTTKENNNGTGVGLYVAKFIIENSFHGKIIVNSENGNTIFVISIRKSNED